MPRKKRREYGVGSVYYDKSLQRWVGKYRAGSTVDGKPRYRKVYAASREAAQAAMDAAIRAGVKLQPQSAAGITIEAYLASWLQTKQAKLAPKSYDRLEQTARLYVVPAVGKITVDELRSDDVDDMLSALQARGYSYSTIKKAKEILQSAYTWGQKTDPPKVTRNPAAAVELPGVKALPRAKKRPVYYDLAEARAICKAGYARWGNGKRVYRLGAVAELLINTGMRLGEVVALEWSRDVNLDARTVSISCSTVHVRDHANDAEHRYHYVDQASTKTAAGERIVVLNDRAVAALRDLHAVTGMYRTVLATEAGTPVRERALDRLLAAIGERAGIPGDRAVSAHKLRHTFASLYLFGGGPGHRGDVKILSQQLGHSTVSVTYDIYAHVLSKIAAEDVAKTMPVTGEVAEQVQTPRVQKGFLLGGHTPDQVKEALASLGAMASTADS